MTRVPLVVIVVLTMWLGVGVPPAAGLYGDPLLLTGTVALWPPDSFGYRLAVVRGEDGNNYFVRFTPATQIPSAVNVGDDIVIVGREMAAPDEITAVSAQHESAVASLAAPSPSASPRDASTGHESVVRGRLVGSSGTTWVLATDRGRTLAVDASAAGNTGAAVATGQRVTVVGRFVNGGLLAARGVTTDGSPATR